VKRREAALEAWCVKWARSREIVVAKLKELDGVPDRVFFIPGGSPVIIEFKALKKKLEAVQSWYMKKLQKDGYRIYRCDTKQVFLELMEKYKWQGQYKTKK
jgi:hypothetical protein